MADGNAVALRAPLQSGNRLAPIVPATFEEAQRIARALHASGLAPNGIDTEEKVLAVVMAGLEVGLPPYQALQSFAFINNRISLWGDAMVAIARSNGFSISESLEGDLDAGTAKAICKVRRPDTGEEVTRTFSVADAKRAGLWQTEAKVRRKNHKTNEWYETANDSPWFKYPQRMLPMRARSWALRDAAADVLRGIPMAEEVEDMGRLNSEPVDDAPPAIAQGSYLKGKAKDEAVEAMNAKIAAAQTPAALVALKPEIEALASRVSKNAAYGLEEAYAQREHALGQATEARAYADHVAEADPVLAVLNGQEPEAASPFEALKEQGLAVLSEDEGREDRLNAWAQALTQEALAGCTEDERNELRVLYRNVRAEVRP